MVLLLEIAINSHVLIPVPTEGTIIKNLTTKQDNSVLIPVPMKGTMRKQSLRLSRRGFNPRTHVGYDHFAKNTHLLYIFNPRTREGYDNTSNLKYYRF